MLRGNGGEHFGRAFGRGAVLRATVNWTVVVPGRPSCLGPAPETMCHRLQLDWSTRGSTSSAIVATALGQLWPYPLRLLCTSGAPWQVQSAMKIGARVAVAPKHGERASAPRILACRIESRCHRIVRASTKLLRGGGTQHMCPELVIVELAHYLPPIQDNCDRRCTATGHAASTTSQQKVRICSCDSPGWQLDTFWETCACLLFVRAACNQKVNTR
jgi:hypothetical protein